jgi:hypothetical protein
LEILENVAPSSIHKIKKEEGEPEEFKAIERISGKRKSPTSDNSFNSPANQFALSTGDSVIDELLGGGVRRGCLTEIVGESSSGKSQLGMQTAVFTAIGLAPISAQDDFISEEDDDLYEALGGRGIRSKSETGCVAILNSGGAAVGRMMIRRMVELTNFLVEERWKLGNEKREASQTLKRRKTNSAEEDEKAGLFREDGKRSSLEEAQQMAKARLLDNIKLCSPKDYESLEHTVSYFLPALIEGIRQQGKAPLTLVILDDLPTMLIEEGDSINQKEHTLRRSRFVCEIADRLKRLSVTEGGSNLNSAVAILVMNQVVDAMARNKKLFLPLLLPTADPEDNDDEISEGPPPLSSAFQDGFFNGLLASADERSIADAREDIAQGKDEEEAINRVSSTSKMAALGYSWVNCINVRIMLTRTKRIYKRKGNEKVTIRRAVSVINPFAKAGQGWHPHVEYAVLPEGLKSISTLQSGSKATNIDDEEAMWSSVDANLEPADVNALIDREEQSKQATDEEEAYWAVHSDFDDDIELPLVLYSERKPCIIECITIDDIQ